MSKEQQYRVLSGPWVAGQRCSAGSTVLLTPEQAQYEHVTPIVIGVDLASGADETVETVVKSTAKKSVRK